MHTANQALRSSISSSSGHLLQEVYRLSHLVGHRMIAFPQRRSALSLAKSVSHPVGRESVPFQTCVWPRWKWTRLSIAELEFQCVLDLRKCAWQIHDVVVTHKHTELLGKPQSRPNCHQRGCVGPPPTRPTWDGPLVHLLLLSTHHGPRLSRRPSILWKAGSENY